MDVKQTGKDLPEQPISPQGTKIWVGTWLLFAAGSAVVYILLSRRYFELPTATHHTLQNASFAAMLGFVVIAIAHFAIGSIKRHTHSKAARYNLIRFIRLLAVLLVIGIAISSFYSHWYTAAVSLGLISLILGFALQTPISSFIGWLYIILRKPFRVGDRIQIDTFKGDVVEISYLDTTLWEVGGDYMTSDLPTGRLIRFPNSLVLGGAIYNYSWDRFPYIWNELPLHIAYESDFEWVAGVMREQAKAILGPGLEQHVERLREMIHETAIDNLEIKEYPFVTLRTNANTWVEVTLIYLVPPRHASAVRSQMLKACVAALLKEPTRVMFPNGNNR